MPEQFLILILAGIIQIYICYKISENYATIIKHEEKRKIHACKN